MGFWGAPVRVVNYINRRKTRPVVSVSCLAKPAPAASLLAVAAAIAVASVAGVSETVLPDGAAPAGILPFAEAFNHAKVDPVTMRQGDSRSIVSGTVSRDSNDAEPPVGLFLSDAGGYTADGTRCSENGTKTSGLIDDPECTTAGDFLNQSADIFLETVEVETFPASINSSRFSYRVNLIIPWDVPPRADYSLTVGAFLVRAGEQAAIVKQDFNVTVTPALRGQQGGVATIDSGASVQSNTANLVVGDGPPPPPPPVTPPTTGPVVVPTQPSFPSGGGGGRGGGGGGGGVGHPVGGPINVDVYSVSWDCNEGYTRIVTSDSDGLDVQVLSAQGKYSPTVAETQDLEGRTIYETDYIPGFFSLKIFVIDGRSLLDITKTVQTGDACTGSKVFKEYAVRPAPVAMPVDDDEPVMDDDKGLAPFVDPLKDPLTYVARYVNEESYRDWFERNYAEEYGTICAAVGLDEGCVEAYKASVADKAPRDDEQAPPTPREEIVIPPPPPDPDEAMPDEPDVEPEDVAPPAPPPEDDAPDTEDVAEPTADDNGCLIATAAYGTELAPQVQALREIRDATLLQSGSGAAFMSGFSNAYYAFSPTVADLERESPVFREAIRLLITPMIATLSVMMPMADGGSEESVLLYGIASIVAIAGLYVAAPAYAAHRVRLALAGRRRSA